MMQMVVTIAKSRASFRHSWIQELESCYWKSFLSLPLLDFLQDGPHSARPPLRHAVCRRHSEFRLVSISPGTAQAGMETLLPPPSRARTVDSDWLASGHMATSRPITGAKGCDVPISQRGVS